MKDIIIDTLIDGIKLLPFLFIAFLLIELFEHKFSDKSKKIITKSGKFGPLIGSMLGLIPQCGFSVMATNLYVTRIISLGTLIAIYLSTSDEMLPLLISQNANYQIILKLLAVKFLLGLFWGFLIDFLLRKKQVKRADYHICEDDHCHCEDNLFKSTIKHTFNTFIFIILITFILNLVLSKTNITFKDSLFAPFIASLIGLIPNCGASVMLTELYLNNALSFASVIGGLLTSSGVALLVLFKTNKNIKENCFILLLLYLIGSLSGFVIELIGILC